MIHREKDLFSSVAFFGKKKKDQTKDLWFFFFLTLKIWSGDILCVLLFVCDIRNMQAEAVCIKYSRKQDVNQIWAPSRPSLSRSLIVLFSEQGWAGHWFPGTPEFSQVAARRFPSLHYYSLESFTWDAKESCGVTAILSCCHPSPPVAAHWCSASWQKGLYVFTLTVTVWKLKHPSLQLRLDSLTLIQMALLKKIYLFSYSIVYH